MTLLKKKYTKSNYLRFTSFNVVHLNLKIRCAFSYIHLLITNFSFCRSNDDSYFFCLIELLVLNYCYLVPLSEKNGAVRFQFRGEGCSFSDNNFRKIRIDNCPTEKRLWTKQNPCFFFIWNSFCFSQLPNPNLIAIKLGNLKELSINSYFFRWAIN